MVTKIERPERPVRPSRVKPTQRGKAVDGTSFVDRLDHTGEVDGSDAIRVDEVTSHITSLESLNPLLALQEMQSNPIGDALARERGEEMLRMMEYIRDSLLWSQNISSSALETLQRNLRNRPDINADTKLREIVDEIELRLAVEIAKRQRDGRQRI